MRKERDRKRESGKTRKDEERGKGDEEEDQGEKELHGKSKRKTEIYSRQDREGKGRKE